MNELRLFTHTYITPVRDIYETLLIYRIRCDSFIYETRPICTWDMTHSYVRHDLSHTYRRIWGITCMSYQPCLMYVAYMNDISTCMRYLWDTYEAYMTYVRHMRLYWYIVSAMSHVCRIHEWLMSHTYMRHVAHVNESCLVCDTGVCGGHDSFMSRVWRRSLWGDREFRGGGKRPKVAFIGGTGRVGMWTIRCVCV